MDRGSQHHNPHYSQPTQTQKHINDVDIREILSGNGEKIVSFAEDFVQRLDKEATTASIRKVYTEVKCMREFNKNELQLLRPKLAYTAKRHNKIEKLCGLLDEIIPKVNNEREFENFKNFFEAILAYFYRHRK